MFAFWLLMGFVMYKRAYPVSLEFDGFKISSPFYSDHRDEESIEFGKHGPL